MFKKENRLRTKRDINDVFENGTKSFHKFFSLRKNSNNLEVSKFAFMVGVRVSKSAIKRNRLRRQLREIVRLNIEKIKPGFNVVVSVGSKALGESYKNLEGSLLEAFSKADLLK